MGPLVKISGSVTADGVLVAAGSLTLADVGASADAGPPHPTARIP
jgi:hypothetical protein